MENKYEESTLLALLAQHDEEALQLIFQRYHSIIYRVAMMYVKSPVIAEEIVQDVFLKLWFQRAQLAEIRSLEAWLFTLTRHLTLNCLKKIAHESAEKQKWVREKALSENTADHKVLQAECQQLYHRALDRLSVQQQQVYRLAKEQGMSYEAISQQLSISPLTVKTHMARALAAIRLFLQQNGALSTVLFATACKFFDFF